MLELYSTMILHNLSFEAVCRDCCNDDPTGRVSQSIMDSINNGLRQKIIAQTLYQKDHLSLVLKIVWAIKKKKKKMLN